MQDRASRFIGHDYGVQFSNWKLALKIVNAEELFTTRAAPIYMHCILGMESEETDKSQRR